MVDSTESDPPPGHERTDHCSQFRSEGEPNTSPRRASWHAALDDESRYWLAEDARYFVHQSLSTPCLDVLRGAGACYIENLRGRRLLDFHGNNVHQVGFGHPRVIAAICEQMQSLSFCPRRYTNIPAIELARKLTTLAPGNLDKVLLSPGGTSAIGMALKLARVATGRFKTVSMWDSFHGASLDAISIGGEAMFRHGVGPLLPGTEHVPPCDPPHCPWQCAPQCTLACADYLEYVLDKEGDVCAVIAETVRSTPYIPPPGYWKKIRAACDRHGALLILDEIPHCLGRTGAMFACQHYGVVPDMLVLGKGLGGGVFPLAALLVRGGLDVATDRALGHYTHEKNPVAAAAALAAIDVIETEGLVENARRLGQYGLQRLEDIKSRHGSVADVRGLGLLMGMELLDETGERAFELAEEVMYQSLARGLSFKLTMGNIVTLTPALTISRSELDHAFEILESALSEAEQRV